MIQPILVTTIMADIDNIWVLHGRHFGICYEVITVLWLWCITRTRKSMYESCHIHGNWNTTRQRKLWPCLQTGIYSVTLGNIFSHPWTSFTYFCAPSFSSPQSKTLIPWISPHAYPQIPNSSYICVSFIFRWCNSELQAPFLFSSHLAI